jgi:F-type H+-transporting ATPase subunit b
MRDIIQRVMAAEGEAKEISKASREEAGKLLATARQRAQETVEQARAEARAEADRIIAQAEADVLRQRNEQLHAAELGIQEEVQLDEVARRAAVSALLRCVCDGR